MTTDGHRPTRIVIDETHRHSIAEFQRAYNQAVADAMAATGGYPIRVLLGADQDDVAFDDGWPVGHPPGARIIHEGPVRAWILPELWDAAESPTVAPLGDIAYPDDHGTGCWKTLPTLQVCNAPVPDDDPLGLCPTHRTELRSDA